VLRRSGRARLSRLHISDNGLPAIIDVDVLDPNELMTAMPKPPKNLDRSWLIRWIALEVQAAVRLGQSEPRRQMPSHFEGHLTSPGHLILDKPSGCPPPRFRTIQVRPKEPPGSDRLR
jgi:hypothetical protein